MSTEMIWQTSSTDSGDTEVLGEILGSLVKPPALIELNADLGGGKTTFVRGLAKGMKSLDAVGSPTFTLSKVYKCPGNTEIHHFDFYRLSEPGLIADQLAESLDNPQVVTIIEWAGIANDILPKNRIKIAFQLVAGDSEQRSISFSYGEPNTELIKSLETAWQGVKP